MAEAGGAAEAERPVAGRLAQLSPPVDRIFPPVALRVAAIGKAPDPRANRRRPAPGHKVRQPSKVPERRAKRRVKIRGATPNRHVKARGPITKQAVRTPGPTPNQPAKAARKIANQPVRVVRKTASRIVRRRKAIGETIATMCGMNDRTIGMNGASIETMYAKNGGSITTSAPIAIAAMDTEAAEVWRLLLV